MWEEGALLGDIPQAAVLGRDVETGAEDVAVRDHDATGIRAMEAGDDPQQSGLAAPGRAEDRRCGAGANREVDAVEHRHGTVAGDDPFSLELAHRVSFVELLRRSQVSGADTRIIMSA